MHSFDTIYVITCGIPIINKEGFVSGDSELNDLEESLTSNNLEEVYEMVNVLIKNKYLKIKNKKIYITEYVIFNGKYIRQDNSHIECILIDQKY